MKYILITLGSISLALGIAGIFLPLLPTTPFLLLSTFLYAKSSDKLYKWLLEHKHLGKIISDFYINKSIPLKAKILSIMILWTSICYTAFFILNFYWLQIALLALATGVTIYLLSFKTKK